VKEGRKEGGANRRKEERRKDGRTEGRKEERERNGRFKKRAIAISTAQLITLQG